MRRASLLPRWPGLALVTLSLLAVSEGGETAPLLRPDRVESLAGSWRFRAGDQSAWAGSRYDDSSWSTVQVPTGWGRKGPRAAMAWYRLDLQVEGMPGKPPQDPWRLALLLGKVDSAYEVYAGGRLLGGVGRLPPDPSPEYDRHRIIPIPRSAVSADGRLVVALRVWKMPETHTHVGGPVEGPFLAGPIEELTRREVTAELPDLVFAAVFLLAGLIHLEIWLGRRERREYLWFALVALDTAAYTFLRTQWKYSVSDDFLALKKAEHLLLYLGAASFVQFLWPVLGRAVGPWLRGYQWGNLAVGALVLVTPGLGWNLRVLPLWQAAAVLATAAFLWLVASEAWKGHPEARLLGVGFVVFAAAYLNDAAVDRGFLETPRLFPFGFAVFLIAMTLTLSDRFSRAQRDLEELRGRLEERVRERTAQLAEANRAKSRFVVTMSHEIRTPMTGVVGIAHLLEQTPLTPEQKEYVSALQISAKALLETVGAVLDFSKIEAGKVELEAVDFDLDALLREVVVSQAELARQKGIALDSHRESEVPRFLRGDPLRLRQALANLVANAVKFTQAGRVAVDARLEERSEGQVRLRLVVEDTGIGIPPEAQARIFESFTQASGATSRHFGGTGLGLSIVKSLAGLMGGEVGLSSSAGEGSRFWFTARLALGEDPGRSAIPAAPVTGVRGPLQVLLVEDHPINRRVAIGLLESLGCSVEVALEGPPAVERCLSGAFDVVLLDCQLPVMDGYTVAREIRSREAVGVRTPLVAVTANAHEEERDRCLAAGMDAFLAKPYGPAELAATLDRVVHGSLPPPLPPASEARAPVLDEARLAELSLYMGEARVQALTTSFLSSAGTKLDEIRQAVAARDRDRLLRLIHGLKGSAGLAGASGLAGICEVAEGEIRAGGLVEADELASRLETCLRETESALAARPPGA